MSLFFLSAAVLLLGGITVMILSGDFFPQPSGQAPKMGVSAGVEPQFSAEAKGSEETPEPLPEKLESFPDEELSEKISLYLQENGIDSRKISYCVRDLLSGKEISLNKTEDFTAASVYKLPLSMLYYEAVAEGKISPETKLLYEAKAYEPGGPIGDNYASGSEIPLKTLLYACIVYSDNTAGHILFENLGGWPVFRKKAAKYARHPLNESFFSSKNILTAEYTADLLQYLYEHQEIFSELIFYLSIAQPNDYLNSELPEIAYQKYGYYGSAVNAAGLIPEGRPYAIAVFTDLGDSGRRHIGRINRICYEILNRE